MTGRDPIFGRRLAAPYAGGTGNAQAGPSTERQQREDEEGISQARQTLVVGFLGREGPLGMTIKELSKVTGWHHGQASNALSVLDTAGEIVRLDERREKQSVYVLKDFLIGRPVAKRRKSAADAARAETDRLKADVARLRTRLESAASVAMDMNKIGEEQTQKIAELEAALLREQNMAAVTITSYRQNAELATGRLEQVQAELDRMTHENSAHRISSFLRMTLEPDETAMVLRVATMLGDPRAQNLQDDYRITSTLGVMRGLMRIVSRSTKFSQDGENPDT